MYAITVDPLQNTTTLQTIPLEDAAREDLAHTLANLPSPHKDFTDFVLAVQPAFASLPAVLRKTIFTFRDGPTAPDVMHFRNLPCDPHLPATPYGPHATEKASFISEACAVGLAQFLGSIFSYRAKDTGALIQEITPLPGQEGSMTGRSSQVDFGFHIDYASMNPRPHFLVLICLRADRQGAARTQIVAAKTLVERLDAESVATLRTPEFAIQAPEDFVQDTQVWRSAPGPILTGPSSCPEIWLNLYGVQPLSTRAERALTALRHVLQLPGVVHSVSLQPGDGLVLNNRKVMHARSAFSAAFDGHDRWLQRVYAHADLWPWRGQLGAGGRLV